MAKPASPGAKGQANALTHVPATAPAWGLRAAAADESVAAFKAANPQLAPKPDGIPPDDHMADPQNPNVRPPRGRPRRSY